MNAFVLGFLFSSDVPAYGDLISASSRNYWITRTFGLPVFTGKSDEDSDIPERGYQCSVPTLTQHQQQEGMKPGDRSTNSEDNVILQILLG